MEMLIMEPRTMTGEEYFAICTKLYNKGWLPTGAVGQMLFRRGDKTYDLSAADLDQLDRIEREGLFVVNTDQASSQANNQAS